MIGNDFNGLLEFLQSGRLGAGLVVSYVIPVPHQFMI